MEYGVLNTERLKQILIKHEGLRLKPYTDTVGKLTIGVGRNLDDRGISKDEALYMLENDIKIVEKEAREIFENFDQLDDVRQEVILNMLFNLGKAKFLSFKKFIQAVKERNFEKAADEMLNSKWARQVGKRAQELSFAMRNGFYETDV